MPNRFVPLGEGTQFEQAIAVLNANFAQLDSEGVTKVFKGPNNVDALITGKLPNDLGYGFEFSDSSNIPRIILYIDSNNKPIFKMSSAGVDVTTATNEQLTFDSSRKTLQVHGGVMAASISATTIAPGNTDQTTTVDISSFGLTSTPLILAFFTVGTSGSTLGATPYGGTQIELIGGTGTLNTFSILTTAHTNTSAVFKRRYVNNSGGNATAQAYSIAFIVCTQTAS